MRAGVTAVSAAVGAAVLGTLASSQSPNASSANLVLNSTSQQSTAPTGVATDFTPSPGYYGFAITDHGFGAFPETAAIAGHADTTLFSGVLGYSANALEGVGVQGQAEGTYGYGVVGKATGGANSVGVLGYNNSGGAGVVGNGRRGGQFTGVAPAVQLVPTSAASHPTRGTRGDLYVDKTGRLWYCKKGGASSNWIQLA